MGVKTYCIDIIIEEFNRERALAELERVVRDMTECETTHCSAHPASIEPYLPYTYISCREGNNEIYDKKWLDEYGEEEKKSIVFDE